MRILRMILLVGGSLAFTLLIRHFGSEAVIVALARITWWQFILVCVVHGISMVLDTLGWRSTLVTDRPAFSKLLAARSAGQAVNVVTAFGGVGGEAVKAWLLRRDIPYEASVPSLILAKTAEVVAQALLLVTGILVAWATGVVGGSLLTLMCYLLVVELIGVGGFVFVQVSGGLSGAGRLLAWMGAGPVDGVQRVDRAVRKFYRSRWRSLLVSVGFHFGSWLIGAVEVLLILWSLHVPASLVTATVIEALGTGVRFATFFIPASLGTLEGANAVAFTALGWAASHGLAFSLVRRARQAVWIGLGLGIFVVMGATRAEAKQRVEAAWACAD
jgi:uncharacterized membrane protein YbhN (UPF0104 family)